MNIRHYLKPARQMLNRASDLCRKTIQQVRKGASFILQYVRKGFSAIQEHYDTVGYYTVLLLVLTALATAAYSYRNGGFRRETVADVPQPTPEAAIAVQSQPLPLTTEAPEVRTFIMPVDGEIRTAYSAGELSWSETLGMWQTHPAIDVAASGGEAVLAAADGTVLEAYSDALYGNTIVIDHGDGCVIRYAALNTLQMVTVGQQVRQGDVISAVGSCSAEAELGAHLHLEYFKDGEAEDFAALLQEN